MIADALQRQFCQLNSQLLFYNLTSLKTPYHVKMLRITSKDLLSRQLKSCLETRSYGNLTFDIKYSEFCPSRMSSFCTRSRLMYPYLVFCAHVCCHVMRYVIRCLQTSAGAHGGTYTLGYVKIS